MMKRLLDNWSASGSDIEEFKKVLSDLASITKLEKVEARDITLYSKNVNSELTSESAPVYVLDPTNLWSISRSGYASLYSSNLPIAPIRTAGADPLIDEYDRRTRLMIGIKSSVSDKMRLYFTSLDLSPTLGLRTEMKGEAACVPSLERDILSAQRLNSPNEISLITRTVNGIKKIYAALSATYAYVPQTFMSDVIDRIQSEGILGSISCKQWNVTNQLAEIYLEFPDKASEIADIYGIEDEIVPGIYMSKSDVGECSITVRATYRIRGSITILDELKRKHTGKIKIEDVLADADKIVFSKYTKLPELLCDLMATDITNPTWATTLTEKKFKNLNYKTVSEAYKKVFKAIGMVDAIGKKHEKEVYEQLCLEIDPSLAYTAYDIVIRVMTLPEHISGLSNSSVELLAKACGKAAFTDFSKPVPVSKAVITA